MSVSDGEISKVDEVRLAVEVRLDETELGQELVLPVHRVLDTVDAVPVIHAVVRHGDHDLIAFLLARDRVEGREERPVGVRLQHLEPVLLALDALVDIRARQKTSERDLPRVLLAGDERANGLASRVLDDLTPADVHATHW